MAFWSFPPYIQRLALLRLLVKQFVTTFSVVFLAIFAGFGTVSLLVYTFQVSIAGYGKVHVRFGSMSHHHKAAEAVYVEGGSISVKRWKSFGTHPHAEG
jgi:hypothetical protein